MDAVTFLYRCSASWRRGSLINTARHCTVFTCDRGSSEKLTAASLLILGRLADPEAREVEMNDIHTK